MKTLLMTPVIILLITIPICGQEISIPSTPKSIGMPSSLFASLTSLPHNDSNLVSIATRNIIWKPFNVPTIGVQVLLGAGLGVGFFELGYSTKPTSGDGTGMGAGLAVILASIMGGAALPCGVFVGGDLMGGNGDPVYTVTGCILGGGIGALPNIISGTGKVDETVALVSVTALLGGITGYHLSASPIYESNFSLSQTRTFYRNIKEDLNCLSPTGMNPNYQIISLSIAL